MKTTFTVRIEPDQARLFSALCTLNNTSITNVLRDFIADYINKNSGLLNMPKVAENQKEHENLS